MVYIAIMQLNQCSLPQGCAHGSVQVLAKGTVQHIRHAIQQGEQGGWSMSAILNGDFGQELPPEAPSLLRLIKEQTVCIPECVAGNQATAGDWIKASVPCLSGEVHEPGSVVGEMHDANVKKLG
jgi:hypothetical protein